MYFVVNGVYVYARVSTNLASRLDLSFSAVKSLFSIDSGSKKAAWPAKTFDST